MLEELVIFSYVAWFTTLAACQTRSPLRRAIGTRDLFHLFPSFRLFSGRPLCDYEFEWRVARRDGTLSDWQPLPIPYRNRGGVLWHPELLDRTIMLRIADRVSRAATGEIRALTTTHSFRSFLGFLFAHIATDEGIAVQFQVTAERRFDPGFRRERVFVSDLFDFADTRVAP